MPTTRADRDRHNAHQRAYYESRSDAQNFRVALRSTPYVANHVARMIALADLRPGQRVLDVGCGMGKFTIPLAEQGIAVDAMDLSPHFLAKLREGASGRAEIRTFVGDLLAADEVLYERYDRVIGFFMLHHLIDIPRAFAQVRKLLVPDGRIAFIEPNPLCPLYFFQITLAPNMSWRAEKGILKLGKRRMLETLAQTGFRDARIERYGILPPLLRNGRYGGSVDGAFDACNPLRPIAAFQAILAGG